MDPAGAILVTGSATDPTQAAMAVWKILPDGSGLDTSFGGDVIGGPDETPDGFFVFGSSDQRPSNSKGTPTS